MVNLRLRALLQIPSGRTTIEGLSVVVAAIAVGLSASGVERLSVVIFSVFAAAFLLPEAWCTASAWWRLRRRRIRSHRSPVSFGALAAFLIVASVGLTHWPLRVAYAISRSALDVAAQRLRSGEPLPTPTHLGLFTIRRAELGGNWNARVVCFWTELDPNGKTGLVHCGDGEPPFNLWSNLPLGDGWQLVAED